MSAVEAFKVLIIPDGDIYHPGDTITGKVYLDLMKHLTCDVMKIQLFGRARVYWTDRAPTASALCQTRAFEQKQILVDRSAILWQKDPTTLPQRPSLEEITRFASSTAIRQVSLKNENVPGFAAGRHELAFEIDLPIENLQSSFESHDSPGSVQYVIEFAVYYNNRMLFKCKELIAVVVDVALSDFPNISLPIEKAEVFNFGKDGSAEVLLKLAKRGYVTGESLGAEITLQNKSSKSVKYCTLNIVQRQTCVSKEPYIACKDFVHETPGLPMPFDKILSGKSVHYNTYGAFYVPALPLVPALPDFFIVHYEVQLTIGFKRLDKSKAFGRVTIPITVGSIPITSEEKSSATFDLRQRCTPSAPMQLPTFAYQALNSYDSDQPPAYEDLFYQETQRLPKSEVRNDIGKSKRL